MDCFVASLLAMTMLNRAAEPMAIIENTIATGSAGFKANRDGMLSLIARMRALEDRTRTASAAAKDRFHKRGQLLPRERVALVLDPGSPFRTVATLDLPAGPTTITLSNKDTDGFVIVDALQLVPR